MGKQFWGTTGLGQGEDFKQSSNTTTSGASETIQIIVLVRVYSQNEKATQRTPQKQGTYPNIFETTTWFQWFDLSRLNPGAETPERQKNKIWKQHHHHREKQFPGAAGTQDSRQILRGVNIVWSKELSTRTSCFVLAKLNISFFMPLARIQNIIDTLVKMGCLFPQRRATSWHQHGYSILSCSEL